jgi:protein-S-isoprenylcysteine O-methyltransferase Ste14
VTEPGRDGDRNRLAAGYAGLAGFFALEVALRHRGDAASLAATDDDRGTTALIIATYALAAELPLVARRLPGRPLPRPATAIGLAAQAAGTAIRAWSMHTLGASYTRTLRTEGGVQPVVDSGPYRWVRHPGYAGSLLIWTGFATSTRSAPVVALTTALLGIAYARRITAEEQLLRRDLPGYAAYCARTRRLVPLLW